MNLASFFAISSQLFDQGHACMVSACWAAQPLFFLSPIG